MIKQWMEFCKVAGLDAKEVAEACMDSLPDYRALFHRLALDAPRKEAYTVFLHKPGAGTPIQCYQAYTLADAKAQALCAWPGFKILGVAQGDITVLEWTDET
jgi:hypothetical protein